jgi:hypothetical protein
MRGLHVLVGLFASIIWADAACAQPAREGHAPTAPDCPPDVKGDGPVVGRGDQSQSLSDKLSASKGIICPPAGIDPEMHVPPPAGGKLKVIPPPDTPGGSPNLQPK